MAPPPLRSSSLWLWPESLAASVCREYSYQMTPVIPPPRRCFICQRYRYISNQCRSSRPICEFCSEHHRTDSSLNRLCSAFSSNCRGDHVATSRDCLVYQYEFELSKYCYWNGCGFGEADLGSREQGILRPGRGLMLIWTVLLWATPHNSSVAWILIRAPLLPFRYHRGRVQLWRSPGPSWTLVALWWRILLSTPFRACSGRLLRGWLQRALHRVRGVARLGLAVRWALAYPRTLFRFLCFSLVSFATVSVHWLVVCPS